MGMLGVWVGQGGLIYVSPKNLCDDELLLLTIFCHTMSFRCAETMLRLSRVVCYYKIIISGNLRKS